MVDNNDFTKAMRDSTAASSKSMTATNWFTEVEPQLQKVRAKGIKVLVFGGDKSQINVTYTKDSITYYAARMENTFTDAVNNVIVINYIKNKAMECNYVTLDHINDATDVLSGFTVFAYSAATEEQALLVRQFLPKREIALTWRAMSDETGTIQILRINGALFCLKEWKANAPLTVHIDKPGVYVAKAMFCNSTKTQKFVVQ